jgi:hypothetical protein
MIGFAPPAETKDKRPIAKMPLGGEMVMVTLGTAVITVGFTLRLYPTLDRGLIGEPPLRRSIGIETR